MDGAVHLRRDQRSSTPTTVLSGRVRETTLSAVVSSPQARRRWSTVVDSHQRLLQSSTSFTCRSLPYFYVYSTTTSTWNPWTAAPLAFARTKNLLNYRFWFPAFLPKKLVSSLVVGPSLRFFCY